MRYAPTGGRLYYVHPASRMGFDGRYRVLSAGCYFGLAPWLWFAGAARQRNLLSHHLLHSLMFSLLGFGWVLLMFALMGVYMLEMRFDAAMSATARWVFQIVFPALDWAHTMAILILLLAWCVSVVDAARGKIRYFPLITRWAERYRLASLSAYLLIPTQLAFLYLSYAGVRAAQIVSAPPEKADVYVLYTVGGYLPINREIYGAFTPPQWSIALAFYPMLDAGIEKWGEGRVKVMPLSESSFNEAATNGRVIFVASHGGDTPGSFTISYFPYRAFKPSDVAVKANPNLQFVYFAGCDTGDLAEEWKRALAPAEVKSFDRISFVEEHLLWVWLQSPRVIAALR